MLFSIESVVFADGTQWNSGTLEEWNIGAIRLRIWDCGLRPVGGIGAYPPACKPMAYNPTGWKRPRRDFGFRSNRT